MIQAMSAISHLQRVLYFPIRNLRATQQLVEHLVTSPDDSIILPYIDHPGPLASEILSKNFRSLTVCEPDPTIRDGFQTFVANNYPRKNVHVHPDDLFELSYKTHSEEAQKRCADLVVHAHDGGNPSSTGTKCDRNVKLLIPLLTSKHEAGVLRNLYYQVCLRLGLCSNYFVNYYFLMSDRQWAYMTAKTGDNMMLYRSYSVLYNTIFRMRTLDSYDLGKCFNINIRKIQNTASARNSAYSKVHLVLLQPNLDVINILSPRSFLEFRFLVTQMMHKRTRLVFTFLDSFFGNYKNDLTSIGVDGTTRCGDLTKEQYFDLFLYLAKRPDYRSSTFLQAVSKVEDNIMSL